MIFYKNPVPAHVLGGKCTIKFNKVSILKEFTSNSFSRTQTAAGTIVLCCFLGDLISPLRGQTLTLFGCDPVGTEV